MDIKYIKIKKAEQQIINSKLQTFYDSLIEVFAPYKKYTSERNKESWKEQASFCADKADVVQDIFRSTENEDWIPSFSKNSKNIIAKRIQVMRKNLSILEKIVDIRECHFHPVSNGIINFSIEHNTGALSFMDNFRFNSEINFTAMRYEEDAVKIFDILYTDLYELLNWIAMELNVCEEEYNRHKLRKFFRTSFMKAGGMFENAFRDISVPTIMICALALVISFMCLFTAKATFKSPTEETVKPEQDINTPYQEHTESTADEKLDKLDGVNGDAVREDENQDAAGPEQKEQAETKKVGLAVTDIVTIVALLIICLGCLSLYVYAFLII